MTTYPTRNDHSRRWEELAAEIADAPQPTEHPPAPAEEVPRGSLTVLGSGIQGLGFTLDAEAKIRDADRVFYCVSNPPTQVWLRTMRPDAYDLYVFYDDTKPRYDTYIQMSEAMLHPVRQGLNVVAIFYGHPGIFVLSTHRSVEIARREGYDAAMKPGVSALDCLCADLGVDPSYPGMQTFEATEALLRKRPLDISLHVVLWQVGLIGEAGYRRKGFINDNFPVLVEYLEDHYGADHEVTHYVAARFPSFDPTIAVHRIGELDDPFLRPTFTGISTFYIPPKDAAVTDIDMAVRLGLAHPGSKPTAVRLRKTALYSDRELAAVAGFADFHVPEEYQFQECTRAAEFFIEMTANPALERAYRTDPAGALADDSFPGLSDADRKLLCVRDENFVQVAAKGSRVKVSPNEKFVADLYAAMPLAGAFRAELIRAYRGDRSRKELDAWVDAQSPGADIGNFAEANKRVNASSLLPWTGVYAAADASFVLTVIGSPTHNIYSSVYAGRTLIKHVAFNNSTLWWRAEDGNPHSARLDFSMPERDSGGQFVRTIAGRLWPLGSGEPASTNLEASEVALGRPMAGWSGRYRTELSADGETWRTGPTVTVTPLPGRGHPAPARLLLNGVEVGDAVLDGDSVSWRHSQITFRAGHPGSGHDLQGYLAGSEGEGETLRGTRVRGWDEIFRGEYTVWCDAGATWAHGTTLEYDGAKLRIGDAHIDGATFDDCTLHWLGSGGEASNGSLQFMIDPATGLARFIGTVWQDGPRPASPNILGLSVPGTATGEATPVGGAGRVHPGVWETLGAVGSDAENPAAYFVWSRTRRAQFVSRFVNRLVLQIIERLDERRRSSIG